MTPQEVQELAESTIVTQLSAFGGLELYRDDEMSGLGPHLVIGLPGERHLHVFVRGIETTGEPPPRESTWLAEHRENALRNQIIACFVELFLDRQGKGYGVRWRGLETVKRGVEALKRGTLPADWYDSPESEVDGDEDTPEGEARRWLQMALLVVAGKPTEGIPEGGSCFETLYPSEGNVEMAECARVHGQGSDKWYALMWRLSESRACRYWESTAYGTVKCRYLEEEAIGREDGDYEKALAHFGSEEALAEAMNAGVLFAEGESMCGRVVHRVRAMQEGERDSDKG